MTTEELAELFLCHLYDLAEAAPHPNFLFSVNDFAPSYGVTDIKDLERAINYLGDKGLVILAGFDMLGGISAGITMEGSIFVENGGETGIIAKHRKDPGSFLNEPAGLMCCDPPVVAAASTKVSAARSRNGQALFYPSRAIEGILLDMQDVLDKDSSIADDVRNDLTSDVATLRLQMSKTTRNLALIGALAAGLSTVPSISSLVNALMCLIESSPR